uniref:Uncharacterized protein n=1 Tax=uncultured prokaryote TaxID=198431 RepID=A0A0H5PXB0_9ZZZZ|nr:hypothetical protein [uncultured prokaryote]
MEIYESLGDRIRRMLETHIAESMPGVPTYDVDDHPDESFVPPPDPVFSDPMDLAESYGGIIDSLTLKGSTPQAAKVDTAPDPVPSTESTGSESGGSD